MTILRFNTIFFDFRNAPPPSELDCHRWLKVLGVKDNEAAVISYSKYRKRLTLKLRESETFQKFISNFSDRALIYEKDGEEYSINYLICNGKKRIIKINELPDEIVLKEFISFFGQYGRIISYKWDDFIPDSNQFLVGNYHRETLIIEAELEKDIPSFIFFEGEKLQISYQGQPQTCSVCQSLAHRAIDCPTRRAPSYSPNYTENFPPIKAPPINITTHKSKDPSHSRWITPRQTLKIHQQLPDPRTTSVKNKFAQLSDSTDTSDDENTIEDQSYEPTCKNKNRDKKKKKLTKDFNDSNKKILEKNVEPEPMDTSAQDEIPIPNS